MRRGALTQRSRHLRRDAAPKRGGWSGRSRTHYSGSLRRWANDPGVREPRAARGYRCARISDPALVVVVEAALMQTELRCPRCGDDLGLEDDLLDDGARIRLRCSGCGRWLRVEVVRRLNVVDLGDYAEMRKGLR